MGGHEKSSCRIMNNISATYERIRQISQSRGINRIFFICLGNLCRSPMAEYLFRAYFKNRKNIIMNVSSAGFLNQRGKHVPEEISLLMKNSGIDISGHRSSPITPERIIDSDLIIVMEIKQKDELLRKYPECASRIFLLSQLDALNPEERDIGDPIGQTFSFYQYCFNEIKVLVEELARYILKLT